MAHARDEATPLDLSIVEEPAAFVGRVHPVVEVADHVRAADVAVLEGDEDFVIDLGNPYRTAVRAGAELSQPRPIGLIAVIEPGKFQFHAGRVVRIIVIGDDRHYDTIDRLAAGRGMPVRGAEGGEAEQRPILPAADREVRAIALLAKHVASAGQRVFAGELVADDTNADRRSSLEFWIAVRQAIRFGKGAGD